MKLFSENKKRGLFLFLVILLIFSTAGSVGLAANLPVVKNVIVLVADGMNHTAPTVARWYKGSPLTLDEILVGGVKTFCSNSIITDSAPAATAFATGFKSDSKFISVLPSVIDVPSVVPVADTDKFRPVATVLEAAKLIGKATGIVATSNIQHATPASFSAHWPDRNDYNEISEQQVYEKIDVVLGGGKQYLLPVDQGGKRVDGANLIDILKSMGYEFVENTAAMKNATSDKIWGAFAPDAMAYDIDRNPENEPSLAEMTGKAISVLSKSPKGFFLFVEGSKVDWAAHANDPVAVISDTLSFDNAVKVALDFAKKDKNTLVIAFADHCTGGMAIGSAQTNVGYDTLKLEKMIIPLKKASVTGEGLEKKLNADKSNIAEVMSTYYGITDLTPEETQAIANAKPGSLIGVVGPMISKRSCIGWTTTGHTGEDVAIWAYGPGKPVGLIDNTDIPKIIDQDMRLNLAAVSKKLFVSAADTGFTWEIRRDVRNSGPNNPFVVLRNGNNTAELQASTNIMYLNDKQIILKTGLTYIINGVPYVPQEAVDLLKAVK